MCVSLIFQWLCYVGTFLKVFFGCDKEVEDFFFIIVRFFEEVSFELFGFERLVFLWIVEGMEKVQIICKDSIYFF